MNKNKNNWTYAINWYPILNSMDCASLYVYLSVITTAFKMFYFPLFLISFLSLLLTALAINRQINPKNKLQNKLRQKAK